MRSDAEVVDTVLAGEREAYAILVDRYGRSVRATALGMLHDREAADDVAQEAFVAAYRKLGSLRSRSRFGPWLFAIARHLAAAACRRRRIRATVPMESVAEPAVTPRDGEMEEDLQRVLAAVMKLPGAGRQAVMLRYFDGYSVGEVAAVLGRSVGTVTKQLHRAREKLRVLLEECER